MNTSQKMRNVGKNNFMRKLALSDEILLKISQPARYIGGEVNMVKKDTSKVAVRFAMCFPDTYEIGMSNLGLRILYGSMNQAEGVWCERAFAPWGDMEEEMRKEHIPLYALESGDSLKNFDFVGFSLGYEMAYTNVLNMLDLAHIPLHSDQRGEDDPIIVAGGTENMSAAPYAIPEARWGARMGEKKLIDTMIKDGLWDAYNNYHMGTTAENICDIWGITREELDEFGYNSQQKAVAAVKSGRFKDEIVPVTVKQKKKEFVFDTDEDPRDTTLEKLGSLKGAFAVSDDNTVDKVDMTFEATHMTPSADNIGVKRVTAGNASGINDGAAAIILASKDAVEKYGLKPLFKVISWGQGGVDPKIMGTGPIPASRQAMAKAGLTIKDMDLIEANEAFAAQSIAVARELEFDMSKVNVNGGAIAIGHPVGCSGARIIVTLLHEMMKRDDAKKGLATLCIGGGLGVAAIFEKC